MLKPGVLEKIMDGVIVDNKEAFLNLAK